MNAEDPRKTDVVSRSVWKQRGRTVFLLVALGGILVLAGGLAWRRTTIESSYDAPRDLIVVQYNSKELGAFLEEVGLRYDGLGPTADRDVSGATLFIKSVVGQLPEMRLAVVAVSPDGAVRRYQCPAWNGWTNDKGEFVAWRDAGAKCIQFATGETREISEAHEFVADRSGKYFCVRGASKKATPIAKFNDPLSTAAEVDTDVTDLFYAQGYLYLFGRPMSATNGVWRTPRLCDIFEEKNGALVHVERLTIPHRTRFGLLSVRDMDTERRRLLMQSYNDPPLSFLNALYTYDLDSQELRRVEAVTRGGATAALFLKEDILQSARKALALKTVGRGAEARQLASHSRRGRPHCGRQAMRWFPTQDSGPGVESNLLGGAVVLSASRPTVGRILRRKGAARENERVVAVDRSAVRGPGVHRDAGGVEDPREGNRPLRLDPAQSLPAPARAQ